MQRISSFIETGWRQRFKARSLPAGDNRCGWIETLQPPPPGRCLEGEIQADCAVVGAGFTGLAAARRLAELRPDWRIVVLDAQRAGDGASGRSSGFVVDLAGFIAAMPAGHSQRFIRLSRAGIAELHRLVSAHDIDCDWDDRGFLHAAAGEAGLHSLRILPDWLDNLGETFEWLDHAAMERVTGTSFYRAGLRLPGSILVQAAALVRGLASTLPESVTLFEHSAVRKIEQHSSFHLDAGQGAVVARRLVIAINGYSPTLGVLPRRVFPLITFGSLTRRLTPQQQANLGGEREWGLLAQDPMGSTLRRTHDQRLLIRNTLHYARDLKVDEAHRHRIAEDHRDTLCRRFPQLGAIELDYTWSGVMGASPNLYPFFGRIGKNSVSAAGFTGAGIAMGTISGHLLADLLLDVDSEMLTDRLRLPRPRWIPPEPFLSPGIRFRVSRMNSAAGETL